MKNVALGLAERERWTLEIKALYAGNRKIKIRMIRTTFLLLAISLLVAMCVGSVFINPVDVLKLLGNKLLPSLIESPPHYVETIVLRIYSPRIVLAIIAGATLGVAGTVMQSTLRNPLVSPFTLGLSSAAGFGAALIIVAGPVIFGSFYYKSVNLPILHFEFSGIAMILFAFLFGVLSTLFVIMIGKKQLVTGSIMVLSGVIIGYFFQAGITALKYVSNDAALREITEWLMGGMWGATWKSVTIALPIVVVCSVYIYSKAQIFNAMGSGDEVAKTLGVDVERFRARTLMVVTLATSACISFTGIIGFVGLMAPHICRMVIGNDQRYLIPCSMLMGALILLVSDTVARTILAPIDVPVGVIMYILGGVFFIYLVTRGRGRGIQ